MHEGKCLIRLILVAFSACGGTRAAKPMPVLTAYFPAMAFGILGKWSSGHCNITISRGPGFLWIRLFVHAVHLLSFLRRSYPKSGDNLALASHPRMGQSHIFADCQALTFHNAFSGYLEQGLMVKDAAKLRKNYLKSKYVIFDVISIFPTDLAYLALSTHCFEMVPCPVSSFWIFPPFFPFPGTGCPLPEIGSTVSCRFVVSCFLPKPSFGEILTLAFSGISADKSNIAVRSDVRVLRKNGDSNKLSQRFSYHTGRSLHPGSYSLERLCLFCHKFPHRLRVGLVGLPGKTILLQYPALKWIWVLSNFRSPMGVSPQKETAE